MVDVDRYADAVREFLKLAKLARVRPDANGLGRLLEAFRRLPFENLTKIIRVGEVDDPERLPRMPDTVLADHLDRGTGGTCFALTFFFEQVLRRLGYEVAPVLCDRSYGPNTHCALIARPPRGFADAERRFLVDPGYLFEAPLLIPERGATSFAGPSATTELVRLGETPQLLLRSRREGKTKIRYRLHDRPVDAALFRRRWIESFDWAMMRHLCISRQTDAGQLSFRDGVMRISRRDAHDQESALARMEERIAREFGIATEVVAAAVARVREGRERCTASRSPGS